MDLYAGTLTRYYAHNWKTEAQLWAEENGFGYQKIGPDSEPGEEMSSEEIRQAVEKWRDNLLSAIREHGSRIGSWPEDNEHPYLTNKPDWPAFEALLLYAACKCLGEPLPEKFGKEAQFEDFEISEISNLAYDEDDGILTVTLNDGKTIKFDVDFFDSLDQLKEFAALLQK